MKNNHANTLSTIHTYKEWYVILNWLCLYNINVQNIIHHIKARMKAREQRVFNAFVRTTNSFSFYKIFTTWTLFIYTYTYPSFQSTVKKLWRCWIKQSIFKMVLCTLFCCCLNSMNVYVMLKSEWVDNGVVKKKFKV